MPTPPPDFCLLCCAPQTVLPIVFEQVVKCHNPIAQEYISHGVHHSSQLLTRQHRGAQTTHGPIESLDTCVLVYVQAYVVCTYMFELVLYMCSIVAFNLLLHNDLISWFLISLHCLPLGVP